MEAPLSEREQQILLGLAHQSIVAAVAQARAPRAELDSLPDRLRQPGASFVTLTRSGLLRGCIGTLKHEFPLAQDVVLRAEAAATDDPRFPPLRHQMKSPTCLSLDGTASQSFMVLKERPSCPRFGKKLRVPSTF